MAKQSNTRAYIPENINFLIRMLVELKNSGRQWTLKGIVKEALLDWLQKPENADLIKNHNLLEAMEAKGLPPLDTDD